MTLTMLHLGDVTVHIVSVRSGAFRDGHTPRRLANSEKKGAIDRCSGLLELWGAKISSEERERGPFPMSTRRWPGSSTRQTRRKGVQHSERAGSVDVCAPHAFSTHTQSLCSQQMEYDQYSNSDSRER